MLKYLPKDERALYNARQILMSNSYGVDNAIAKVPAHLKKDPGLEFDRLRWRNRRGRLEGSLEILYKNANRTETQMVRPDLWWEQRKSVARSLIYKKRYKEWPKNISQRIEGKNDRDIYDAIIISTPPASHVKLIKKHLFLRKNY